RRRTHRPAAASACARRRVTTSAGYPDRGSGAGCAILFAPVRIFSFALRFVLTIAVGGAALAGSIALLAPAGRTLDRAVTPLGELDLHINTPASRSIVYDKYGGVMGSFATEDRSPVKLSQVPHVLIDAVLSIEDRKFYEHHGVDWTGTTRALFKN